MNINPALRPISEAPHGEPILAYSADPSPMCPPGCNYSVAYAYIGNGPTPGLFTDKFGFFANFSDLGVTWTHYAPVPKFEA